MKHVCQFWVFLFMALACSGCFPMHLTTRPSVSGVVLDAQTHQPVPSASAAISMSYIHKSGMPIDGGKNWSESDLKDYAETYTIVPPLSQVLTNIESPTVVTGTNGSFAIPRATQWIIYIIPEDFFFPPHTLVVQCPGYEPATVQFWTGYGIRTNMGNIFLKPISK